MRKIIAMLVLAVVLVSFPQVGKCSAIVSDFSSNWREKEFKKRQPITEKWIRSLEEIAKATNHPGVQEIGHFLRWESTTVAPDNNGDGKGVITAIQTNRTDNYPSRIGILPLLPEDGKINKHLESVEKKTNGAKAVYLPGVDPVILIKDVPIHDLWRGINLLHEGIVSAEVLEKERTADPKNLEAWLWERAEIEDSAWGTVTETLKGKDYQALVKMEADRLRSQEALLRPPATPYSRILDLLFGEPLSPFEADLRETALWVSAAIQVIDERNADPLQAQKERIKFFHDAISGKLF